jgi:putative flippase GtrA
MRDGGRSMDTQARYLAVAASCALLHNAVMIGCDWIGVHYLLSSAVSFTTVVMWSYPLHARFTFAQRLSARSFLNYALGMATNYPASIALMFLFHDLAALSVAAASPLSTVILFAWNFAASRWAIAGRPTLQGATE